MQIVDLSGISRIVAVKETRQEAFAAVHEARG
jgi:hypothetical protein